MDEKILANLRDALATLYPDEASIRRVVADAGINAARIRFDTTAQNTWYFVLTEAIKMQRLDTLLDVAKKEYETYDELQKACKEFDYTKKSRIKINFSNPLAGTANGVKEWFFKELHPREQSLLLTTALFEDMSRHQLTQVLTDIEQILSTDN